MPYLISLILLGAVVSSAGTVDFACWWPKRLGQNSGSKSCKETNVNDLSMWKCEPDNKSLNCNFTNKKDDDRVRLLCQITTKNCFTAKNSDECGKGFRSVGITADEFSSVCVAGEEGGGTGSGGTPPWRQTPSSKPWSSKGAR